MIQISSAQKQSLNKVKILRIEEVKGSNYSRLSHCIVVHVDDQSKA